MNLSTSRKEVKGKSSADKYNSTTSGIQALINKEIAEKIEEEDKQSNDGSDDEKNKDASKKN
jgi:hypothetical protein